MKAIHGGKAKNDKIDSHKIAVLLRGGMVPMAYVYPPAMRATRDLLRRRCHLMRKRAVVLGDRWPRLVPLRALRIGTGVVLALAGLVLVIGALDLT